MFPAKYNKQSSSKKKPKKPKKKGEDDKAADEEDDTGRKKKKTVKAPPKVIYALGRTAFTKGPKAVSFGDLDVNSESSGSEADGGSDSEDDSKEVQRQVRCGLPLYLFLLCVEPLSTSKQILSSRSRPTANKVRLRKKDRG